MTEANDTPDLLAQLRAAEASLEHWQQRVADDTSNNPDKHQTQVRNAREAVRKLTLQCKEAGLVAVTEGEAVGIRLDKHFPGVDNRGIVEFEGAHYQRRYRAAQMSRTRKSVTEWEPYWAQLAPGDKDLAAFLDPEGAKKRQVLAAAVRKAWPFTIPAGGLKLSVAVGDEPGLLNIRAGKTAIGYTKGNPDLRVSVVAELALTEEALELLENPKPPRAKSLFLGRDAAGRGVYLVKAGRGSADIVAEEGDPPAPRPA